MSLPFQPLLYCVMTTVVIVTPRDFAFYSTLVPYYMLIILLATSYFNIILLIYPRGLKKDEARDEEKEETNQRTNEMELPPVIQTVGHYKRVPINLLDPICTGLPRSIILPLCVDLSHEQAVMTDYGGGDWRDLAEFIGLPSSMIRTIEDYRGDRTKAFTLLDLWDRGISHNPGTLIKLIIAMERGGFTALLKDFIITPLEDCFDFQAIIAYCRSLTPDDLNVMFPKLDLIDIEWDERLESRVINDISYPGDLQDEVESPHDTRSSSYPPIVKDSIFVSHFSDSRSRRTYSREVENLVKVFQRHKHTVWYGSPSLDRNQQELYIRSAQTIIVVYNEEYHSAHLNYLRGRNIPDCVSLDIPLLNDLFYNSKKKIGGKNRIIPVIIDQVKTPLRSEFPVWLTGVPHLSFPSQKHSLIHTVQGVKEFSLPSKVVEVRRVRPKKINKDEIIRQFQSRRM